MSIIIPTFNRSQLLKRALRSVQNQTVTDLEIIVVDDASDEDLSLCLSEVPGRPVRLLRREVRGGAAAARNAGVRDARGRYVAFLDSDDEWMPEKLERQLAYLKGDGGFPLCCTGFLYQKRGAARPEARVSPQTRISLSTLSSGCVFSLGSCLVVSKAHFQAIGDFDAAFRRLEDWDWLIRASRVTPIHVIPEPLAVVHQSGFPDYAAVHDATARLKRKHLETFAAAGSRDRRRFQAALHFELAVVSAYQSHRARALAHFIRSQVAYPFWNIRQFPHLLRSALAHRIVTKRLLKPYRAPLS